MATTKVAGKTNSAFMEPKNITPELEAVVGKGPMPRSEITSKIWVYIKKHNLQDAKDKRLINTDETLKKIFDGQAQVGMMKIAGFVSKHILK